METTQFFATIEGAYLFVTGLGFLCSTAFYAKMVEESHKASLVTINLSGAAHFLVGMIVLVQHFRWGSVAEAAVSLVGCAAVLKGTALIVVPEATMKSPKTSLRALRRIGVAFLVVGAYLGYVGLFG